MSKITLYEVTHKDVVPRKERTVIGSGIHKPIKGADIYDDTGENIAQKNAEYCELTALYWIWKNDASDCAGLEHYRRFFCKKSVFRPRPVTKENIAAMLEKCDVVAPKKHKVAKDIYRHYCAHHVAGDLDECRGVIAQLFPAYLADFDRVMKSKRCSLYNMFAMKKQLLNGYCEWLFAILAELEKKIDTSQRDFYQRRVYGFIAERLFNVWLEHNKLIVKYVNVYSPGDIPVFAAVRNFFADIAKTFI